MTMNKAKSDYGPLFGKIRQEKNLSLTDLEEEGLSRSFIGKFEKGETKISADRFFRLLSKIQVTPDEFLSRQYGGQTPDYFSRLADRIENNDGKAGHIQTNLQLEKEISQDYAADPSNLAAKYLGIMLHYMNEIAILVRDNRMADYYRVRAAFEKASDEILNYLFNVEIWGKFEIYLYSSFSMAFSPETRMLLLKSALKSSDYLRDIANDGDFAFEDYKILLTVMSNQIYDDLTSMKKTLEMFNERLQERPDIRFKAEYLFELGLYEIATGNQARGEARANNVIKVLTLLADEGEAKVLAYFLQRFKTYLKKKEAGKDKPDDRTMRLWL
ncbi:MAG: helix-turn-helix domain-containing protein [Oenococcus sp.]